VLVLVVLILLFGAKRLPDSARSLGQSLRIFKSEMSDKKDEKKPDQDGQASA
jgi:TatA/E family protein of Tat protein translocase